MRKLWIICLLCCWTVLGTAQEVNQQIEKTLRAFELLVKEAPNDSRNQEFVDRFVRPGEGKAEKWYRYIKQTRAELDGAEMGEPEISGDFVRTYYPRNAAVGGVTLLLNFEEEAPYRLKSLVANIMLMARDEEVEPGMSLDEMTGLLQEKLADWAEEDQFSGVVLLAKEGEPVYQKAFGLASKSFLVLNNLQTKFNLGSVTKVFTAIAIGQLVDQGKLSFDDRVIDILPDYPNREVAENVTVHHLLSHTSGLDSYWTSKYYEEWSLLRSVSDYLPLFVDDDLLFKPGLKFHYSNAGYVVLGLMIEKLSGTNYFDYVRQHIYEPAGMASSGAFEQDRPMENRAVGYTHSNHLRYREAGPRRNNMFQTAVKGSPAGGTYSTVGDLLKFMNHLQNGQLLSKAVSKTLLTPKSKFTGGVDYGYGFMLHQSGDTYSYGHGGGAQGVSTAIRFFPERGYSYVILSNYDGGREDVQDLLDQMILGQELK